MIGYWDPEMVIEIGALACSRVVMTLENVCILNEYLFPFVHVSDTLTDEIHCSLNYFMPPEGGQIVFGPSVRLFVCYKTLTLSVTKKSFHLQPQNYTCMHLDELHLQGPLRGHEIKGHRDLK